jgi:hypothetical protein
MLLPCQQLFGLCGGDLGVSSGQLSGQATHEQLISLFNRLCQRSSCCFDLSHGCGNSAHTWSRGESGKLSFSLADGELGLTDLELCILVI